MSTERKTMLLGLLAWYRDMGVTDAPGEEPRDWLREGPQGPAGAAAARRHAADPPTPGAAPRRVPERQGTPATAGAERARIFPSVPPAAAERDARAAAAEARSLDELAAILARFEGCALRATATNLCFFRGAPRSRLMLIGEAPGREEDLEGRPFVGRAGRLLDLMLGAIGLGESDVHITNIVYWRPPGNRTPTPQEAQVCRPFLLRQIELVGPEFLLLLGGAAAKHILQAADGILRLRGKWRQADLGGRTVPAMATLHPAYLLRTPAAKRLAWRDLLAVQERLRQGAAESGAGAPR